jgi:S-formylglutathione hydrolase FrmB
VLCAGYAVATGLTGLTLIDRETYGLAALLTRLEHHLASAALGNTPASSETTATVIPAGHQLTTDKLEALYAGGYPAERGEWHEEHVFSRALGTMNSFLVWTPPGYSEHGRPYPTLYLLHGIGAPATFGAEEWLGYALTEDLDRLLGLGLIDPMIVVLPNGDRGYWMNHAAGGPRWADFVVGDLVDYVDATFHTDTRREGRAIGGHSMGGHGALQLALNHPEVFAAAGAHSPTLRPFGSVPAFFGDWHWFTRHDPLSLAQRTEAAPRTAFWLDVGDRDQWRQSTKEIALALRAHGAPVEFRELEGEHEGWYWAYYLPEYLYFYSHALHATARTATGAPVVALRPLTPAAADTGRPKAKSAR